MDQIGFLFFYICTVIGVSCIFGAITKAINEGKGYYGGFAWGFWLGWIGIIVVACRESCNYKPTESIIKPKTTPNFLPPQGYPPMPANGDVWTCSCGRHNPRYVTSCACGLNKNSFSTPAHRSTPQQATFQQPASSVPIDNEMKHISILKEYKQLLDTGVITQEEFDEKKSKILSR